MIGFGFSCELLILIYLGFPFSLDTTSSALAWTVYLISTHPEVEEKVVAEINQVLGDKSVPDFEDLSQLRYLSMCIKEGLRLYPSVPTIARYMVEDTLVNGHVIPKGVCVC